MPTKSGEPGESAAACAARAIAAVGVVLARGRSVRVVCLVVVIAMLSFLDLMLTLTYVSTIGMGEQNPIARWIMSHNSALLLGAFKAGTVGLACCILICARRRLTGEGAAWICAALLVWLTVRWVRYNEEAPRLTPVLHRMEQSLGGGSWVRMEQGGG